MEVVNSIQEFKRFIELNHLKIYENAINADGISENDEWMEETLWDDIYKQQVK